MLVGPATLVATLALSAVAAGLCAPAARAVTVGDDFNDNVKDTTKWGADDRYGNGSVLETNHRLEYKVSNQTFYDEADRPWVRSNFPYNTDWELQIDLFNDTTPGSDNAVNSFGIDVDNPDDPGDYFYAELYSSRLSGPPARRGFDANFVSNDFGAGNIDSGGVPVTLGALRVVFSATAKTLTTYYDTDATNGYQWTLLGSFGVAGSGGTDGNANWGYTDSDVFVVDVYGFSSNMVVSGGHMWGDNFLTTGGVPGTGSPVSLEYPNGGESLPAGGKATISWSAPSTAETFSLDLTVNNGQNWTSIATNLTNTSYDWVIPAVKKNSPGSRVRVKAFNASGGGVGKDVSDATFLIEVLRLDAPNGGEIVHSGSVTNITWTTELTSKPVASTIVQLTKDGGSTWTKIATLAGNPGSYGWTVPSVPSAKSRCKVKVILKASDGTSVGNDTSNATFTIAPAL